MRVPTSGGGSTPKPKKPKKSKRPSLVDRLVNLKGMENKAKRDQLIKQAVKNRTPAQIKNLRKRYIRRLTGG